MNGPQGAECIPVGDPQAPLGQGHVEAHQGIVDYLVELAETVNALKARVEALEETEELRRG